MTHAFGFILQAYLQTFQAAIWKH